MNKTQTNKRLSQWDAKPSLWDARRSSFLAAALLCLIVFVLLTVYYFLRPQVTEGMKTVHFEVIVDGETVKTTHVRTDALYLRKALEEAGLVSPDEGMMILTVDGITADGSDGAWWIFTKNGEWLDYGADEQPIEDGEVYEITRTVF